MARTKKAQVVAQPEPLAICPEGSGLSWDWSADVMTFAQAKALAFEALDGTPEIEYVNIAPAIHGADSEEYPWPLVEWVPTWNGDVWRIDRSSKGFAEYQNGERP